MEEVAGDKVANLDCARANLVFLASGATKLVAHASDSREQIVAFHFEGDMLVVPARGSHAYSLVALEDAQLLHFPYLTFLTEARGESCVLQRLLDTAFRSLERCREKTVTLGRKNASERLAAFLLAMEERIGRNDGKGIILDLPMSRRDIADSLGLTIETVSRQFTRLRSDDVIATEGRSIVRLNDLRDLRARAGFFEGRRSNLGKFDLDQGGACEGRLATVSNKGITNNAS